MLPTSIDKEGIHEKDFLPINVGNIDPHYPVAYRDEIRKLCPQNQPMSDIH